MYFDSLNFLVTLCILIRLKFSYYFVLIFLKIIFILANNQHNFVSM